MALSKGFAIHDALPAAKDLRKAFSGMVVRSAAGVPRAGVFPAHTNSIFTAHPDDRAIDVGVFVAALTRGAGDGVAFVSNDGVMDSPLFDPAPASNSRIDVLWLRQNDSVDQADLDDLPTWGIAKGTAAGSPTAPAVPAGATAFANVQIPSGTSFSSEWTITDVYPYTAAAGGVVFVRNATEQTAWTPVNGAQSYRIDTDARYRRKAGAWTPIPDVRVVVGGSPFFGAAPPADAKIIEQMGTAQVNTSLGGDTAIVYPEPFPNGVIAVFLERINFSNFAVTDQVLSSTQSLSQVNFRIYAGSPLASATGVPFLFRAIGW